MFTFVFDFIVTTWNNTMAYIIDDVPKKIPITEYIKRYTSIFYLLIIIAFLLFLM